MRLSIITFLLLITSCSFGQKRIGADINTHLINLNYTIHFQEVIKGPLLYSAGIFFGGYGEGSNYGSPSAITSSQNMGFAYPRLDTEVPDTNGVYELMGYRTKGKGIGIYAGIGLFHEFGNLHGIRFNLNNRFGWMSSKTRSSYYLEGAKYNKIRYDKSYHPSGAISIELYHTMRLTGRNTFYWGFKMPYYYSLDRGRYAPEVDSELFYKFKMDLAIGFTRAIGKCD